MVVLGEVPRVDLHALNVLPHTAGVAADHKTVIVREGTERKIERNREELVPANRAAWCLPSTTSSGMPYATNSLHCSPDAPGDVVFVPVVSVYVFCASHSSVLHQ